MRPTGRKCFFLPKLACSVGRERVARADGYLRIATWNINSVRLRRPLLAELVKALDPDVLCLQETKCPDELFPLDDLRAFGFPHIAHKGMEGLQRRGRAVAPAAAGAGRRSRLVRQGRLPAPGRGGGCAGRAGRAARLLCPRRRRHAGPRGQREVRPQARLPRRGDRLVEGARRESPQRAGRRPQHRPARARRLEPQADARRRLHTPVEVEALTGWQHSAGWHDALRHFVPHDQKLYDMVVLPGEGLGDLGPRPPAGPMSG
ncbi:endonuclease/exonuclease/phosphatase family protein [Dankookia sp. P2]|uniref:endonuclease/exonuclease/phosphatase family protein n=1 Tax=Dankookia sp. P2 TaxID=3423955 RepID=UPI003D67F1A1